MAQNVPHSLAKELKGLLKVAFAVLDLAREHFFPNLENAGRFFRHDEIFDTIALRKNEGIHRNVTGDRPILSKALNNMTAVSPQSLLLPSIECRRLLLDATIPGNHELAGPNLP